MNRYVHEQCRSYCYQSVEQSQLSKKSKRECQLKGMDEDKNIQCKDKRMKEQRWSEELYIVVAHQPDVDFVADWNRVWWGVSPCLP